MKDRGMAEQDRAGPGKAAAGEGSGRTRQVRGKTGQGSRRGMMFMGAIHFLSLSVAPT